MGRTYKDQNKDYRNWEHKKRRIKKERRPKEYDHYTKNKEEPLDYDENKQKDKK